MTIKFAFCSDCDLQTFATYRSVHSTMDHLGLKAGDSFWLFDPSGGDMGLFRTDCSEKGPFHDELLEELRSGRIDVLHSAGSYGARFNNGFRPRRQLVAEALEYLQKHARVPRVWTNHGDDNNNQNIGASRPLAYHHGDDPNSDRFMLDVLLDHGFEYFWTDQHLVRRAADPVRLVAEEPTRSGHRIKVFERFLGEMAWAPNGQNLALQINEANLAHWIEIKQNVILYQHWSCHHREDHWAYTPEGHPLTPESVAAVEWLAEQQKAGRVEVVPLIDLLREEDQKPILEETDRIARVVIAPEAKAADSHYYHQFFGHSLGYFAKRIEHLDPRGKRALDAGCGVGQWTLCLPGRFETIEGYDNTPRAIGLAKQINARARLPISFSVRDIYASGYDDDSFDFVICYGVIFLVHSLLAMRELYRVMAPGASMFLSVNGDGWYQYLVEERFSEADDATREKFVRPLWHAYLARCGGRERVQAILAGDQATLPAGSDIEAVRSTLTRYLLPEHADSGTAIIANFETYLLTAMMKRLQAEAPASAVGPGSSIESAPLADRPLENRSYLPEEFEAVAKACGFSDFRWGRDASLSFNDNKGSSDVPPLHALEFKGNLCVWECIVTKPVCEAA